MVWRWSGAPRGETPHRIWEIVQRQRGGRTFRAEGAAKTQVSKSGWEV